MGAGVAAGAAVLAAVLLWPGRGGADAVRWPTGRGGRAGAGVRRWRRRVGPTVSTGDGVDLLALVELVGAQVRAGASPQRAWQVASEVLGLDLVPEPVAALTAVAARRPPRGADGVPVAAAAAAAGWRLAERTGAPLADVLDAVAASLRQQVGAMAEVEAALAGPRATARLLSGLPLAGLVLGQAVGAHPVTVLLTTRVGHWCALLGVLLLVLGHVWMRRLVDDVVAVR